ncbi:hypothetical protein D3C84_598760 [compost metagenome]
MAVTEVERRACATGQQIIHGECVSGNEIDHVDVIANTGAVRRVVIPTKHGDGFASARGRLQDQWQQVGFRFMAFTQLSFRVGAGGIEVAQAHRFKTVGAVEVFQYLLHHPLAAAIRVDGGLGMFFVDGHVYRVTIDGGGRGKNQVFDLRAHHGL